MDQEQMLEALRELQKDPLGLVFAKLRKERGMSQQDLANAVGLSRPYITQVENGTRTPTPDTAARLAAALGLEPAIVPFITGEVRPDDLVRMSKFSDSLDLVRSRLSDAEWAEVEQLWGDTGWLISFAQTFSAFDDSGALNLPVEPLPHWNSLTPENQRLVRDLVKQLADANDRLGKVLSALSEHRRACPITEDNLVFPAQCGRPVHTSDWNRDVFKPTTRRAVLPTLTLHDLRHTFASALIHQGQSVKYVQTVMGHASAQTTLDVYGHLFDRGGRDAAQRMESWLGPDSSTARRSA